MTKARLPLTFPDAVTRIAGRITWAGCADATGKSERAVRAWSDPEMDRCPCIDDCLALDAAYLAAGGGEPPMLAVYQARLDRAVQAPADSAALSRTTSLVAKEAGEAVAALVLASAPGASPGDRVVAAREAAEAVEVLTEAMHQLGTGAPNLRVA